MTRRLKLRAVAAAVLALSGAPAHADNAGQALTILGAGILTLASGGTLSGVWAYVGTGLVVAGNVYGAASARRQRRRAIAKARAEYNAGLSDRTITALRTNPPWHVGYGRCIKGGEVLDIFGSDKTYVDENGVTRTKADGYKHLVIAFNSRRSQAIHEVLIDGVPVGALDSNGYPTGGEFYKAGTATRTVTFTGSVTLGETPLTVVQAFSIGTAGYNAETVTILGNTLNCASPDPVTCDYTVDGGRAVVRISKHLGSDTEAVDSYFASVAPSRYTSAHGLRGITGICITFDLEDPRFQAGIPNVTADGSWSMVYDPRKDSTVAGGSGSHRSNNPATWEWSDNPALCTADHITAVTGFGAAWSEVNVPRLIASANTCDELIDLVVGSTTTSGQKRYTCNGAFTTESSAEAVLEDLAECMAGNVVYGAAWNVIAGTWAPAVMTLTDDDLRGPIEVAQADTPTEDLFNGLRGQYIPRGSLGPTDINPPYQNSTFVAADGRELWADLDLPFTDNAARARNIARILTERNRAGQVLRYPGKLRTWPLEVGDRVTLTSAEYAISAETYRVTDWQYEHANGGGPILTLQRDYASIWDEADAASALPAPNTDLPNPWTVPTVTSLAAASGTAHLLKQGDGTIIPRVRVTWTPLTNAYVVEGGYVDVQYRRIGDTGFRRVPRVPGNAGEAYITDMPDGAPLLIKVVGVNRFGVRGADAFIAHTVVGKTQPPSTVAGLSVTGIPGGVQVTWTPNADVDYAYTEVRTGASWGAGTRIFRGAAGGFVWPWPAAGSYTVRVRHVDTSGNLGTEVTAAITVGNGSLIGTPNIKPGSVVKVTTPTTATALSVTGSSGTNNNYSATGVYTAVGTHTWTADASGEAFINISGRASFSGAPPGVYSDKLACDIKVYVDFNNDGTRQAGELVYNDLTYGPTPSGVSITVIKDFSARKQITVVAGTTYTWPIYVNKLEGSLTLDEFAFNVEHPMV